MGVTQLWQILAPVEQHRALSSLSGQTLAVDLSIWVCENQCVKQMQGVVSKPYLRNLFFRISHLTQLGLKLVFVIEGAAPELKWDTMIKRQQSRFPGRQGKQAPQRPAGKQTRRNFNSWLKECCELLEILGIPYIQSKGEAEALCALLNANGLVDGCLTNDGDAFLYGATTVYRNFTMNSKDPHVEMYRLCDIQSKLGIDRGGLVALGLLIGCDFVPKGVPGIGIANAVRLLQSLQGQDVLIRLQSWSTMSEKECVDQTEILARRKAIQVPDFPQIKVIHEFLCAKDRCPSRLPEWKRPVPAKLQEFSQIKLEWPLEYTIEKVLPLITLWDMQDLSQSKNPSVHQHLKPHRIVKTRIRQGEPCYEVEWIKPVTDTVTEGSYYVTIESQELFTKCYPAVVKAFITQSTESKKKPKAKKKKKKEESIQPPSLDNLSFQFEKVNLGKVTSKLQDSVKDLHPSFSEYDETTLTTKAKQPRHLTLSPNGKKSVNKGENSESRKPVSVPFSMSDETVAHSEKDLENSSFVPLSQRVKLRMQNKHGNNKENEDKKEKIVKSVINDEKFSVMKSPGADLSNMSSLLEDIQNLSLKEADKFRHKMKEKPGLGSYSKLQQESSPQVMSVRQTTPMSISSRKMSTLKDFQKMSSPSTEEICTPMTYMKHKGALGDSFEIQKSPYYIENPFAPDKSKSEKNVIDISSPGFFSRPEPKKELEEVDTRCAAEKLIEKIESGINRVGTVEKVHLGPEPSQSQKKIFPKNVSGEDKFTVESLMSILNSSSSGKSLATPTQQQGKQKTSTPGNQSAFGLETSLGQFGDFQIQHSLLDSLCSGLVQALTPKGVSMTKDEYDKLLNTLNAMDSEDEEDDLVENGMNENNAAYEGIKCNIDFSELEKASTGFKNLNQKLLLKPIQIDDEDVMAKLSKSARKKLRRRERKREQELESIAQMKNVSKSKGKTKNMTPEQSSRRNSVKSNNSDSSSLDKKMDKRKNKKENVDQNILQTKGEKKFKLDTQCVNKANVKNIDNSPSINLSRNKNLLPDKDHKTFENPPEVTEENNQMSKKKKKKKKVKKASPVIDISADDSILDDKKVSSCAEYLRKALENNQRKSSENKIIKASPFMNVSADDTLLELEGLTCKVIGNELDSDLEIKLKKKKRLSKEKLCSKYGISQMCSLDKEPVLSINDMLKNETDHAESVNSQSCKCQGNLEQNSDGIEKVIDNCEKFDGHSEKVINVEDTVEKDLCQVRSPPENELDDALNVQSSVEFVPNEIEIDGNSVKDEIQVNSSAAKELIRDFKYFDDAEDLLGKRNDMVVPEISENIPENRVDFKVSPNAVDNGSTNKEESKHEKVNIGNSRKSKENKDGDDDSDGSENIVNDIETWNGYDKDNSVMHNVVLENLDMDKTGDTRNDAMGSVGDEDDIVEGIEIANDFVALNTYHENGKDLHDVIVDKATSDDVYIERVIDASNDVVVLNGKENANCVTDKASAADINNKCNGVDNEYEAKNRTVVGKMESESNVEVDVRSENDTAALCINKDVKNLHKVKVEMNDLTELGTGLSVSDHMNENGAHVNGRVEENVQHIINLKSDVNGVDRKQTFSSDSSDDEVEIKNLNGEFEEEFTKEFEVEQFHQVTSSIENFGGNDTRQSEVFQSPACLADRLKLRLRKTSTKNVLDAFTNGK